MLAVEWEEGEEEGKEEEEGEEDESEADGNGNGKGKGKGEGNALCLAPVLHHLALTWPLTNRGVLVWFGLVCSLLTQAKVEAAGADAGGARGVARAQGRAAAAVWWIPTSTWNLVRGRPSAVRRARVGIR